MPIRRAARLAGLGAFHPELDPAAALMEIPLKSLESGLPVLAFERANEVIRRALP